MWSFSNFMGCVQRRSLSCGLNAKGKSYAWWTQDKIMVASLKQGTVTMADMCKAICCWCICFLLVACRWSCQGVVLVFSVLRCILHKAWSSNKCWPTRDCQAGGSDFERAIIHFVVTLASAGTPLSWKNPFQVVMKSLMIGACLGLPEGHVGWCIDVKKFEGGFRCSPL